MSGRLRARAARLMSQLDAGAGYREQIEKDLTARLEQVSVNGKESARLKPSRYVVGEASRYEVGEPSPSREVEEDNRAEPANRSAKASAERKASTERGTSAERRCASCDTVNDSDARFCKGCGGRL